MRKLYNWTPAICERLSQFWLSGLSATECGKALVPPAGKNMVCGKLNRMGLVPRPNGTPSENYNRSLKPVKPAAQPKEVKAKPPVGVAPPQTPVTKAYTPEPLPIKEAVVVSVVPKSKAFDPVGILTARPWEERPVGSCSWPLDGPDGSIWSCCGPVKRAPNNPSGYCEKHRVCSTYPSQPRKLREKDFRRFG